MITDPATREVILSLADDEHLMGQQHTEWIGVAPFLEEDLAFSSIGQDELGHAALLYELLLGGGAGDAAVDALAYDRTGGEYRSAHLVEYATTDWDEAFIRHWLYDLAEELRWSLFAGSSVDGLAELAARAEREEVYHRRHADGLLDALLRSDEAGERLGAALDRLVPMALGLFEPVAGQAEAIDRGAITAGVETLLPSWRSKVASRFPEVAWTDGVDQGNRTVRSADFDPLMARMREVFELDPHAVW